MFNSNSQRVAHRDQLNARIDAVFGQLSVQELVARLQEADIAYGRMNTVEQLAQHPQLRVTTVDTPTGPVTLPAPPTQFSETAEAPRQSVPALGEHTEAIRREFSS